MQGASLTTSKAGGTASRIKSSMLKVDPGQVKVAGKRCVLHAGGEAAVNVDNLAGNKTAGVRS